MTTKQEQINQLQKQLDDLKTAQILENYALVLPFLVKNNIVGAFVDRGILNLTLTNEQVHELIDELYTQLNTGNAGLLPRDFHAFSGCHIAPDIQFYPLGGNQFRISFDHCPTMEAFKTKLKQLGLKIDCTDVKKAVTELILRKTGELAEIEELEKEVNKPAQPIAVIPPSN